MVKRNQKVSLVANDSNVVGAHVHTNKERRQPSVSQGQQQLIMLAHIFRTRFVLSRTTDASEWLSACNINVLRGSENWVN